jgi:hypothetical protein
MAGRTHVAPTGLEARFALFPGANAPGYITPPLPGLTPDANNLNLDKRPPTLSLQ